MNRRGFLASLLSAGTATLALRTGLATAALKIIDVPAPSMEGDFTTENMVYRYRERYAVNWSDVRAFYGTAGN